MKTRITCEFAGGTEVPACEADAVYAIDVNRRTSTQPLEWTRVRYAVCRDHRNAFGAPINCVSVWNVIPCIEYGDMCDGCGARAVMTLDAHTYSIKHGKGCPFYAVGPAKPVKSRCNCEHANHFADNFDGSPKPILGHAYGEEAYASAPANVPFMHGDDFCAWCLINCHPDARHLTVPEIEADKDLSSSGVVRIVVELQTTGDFDNDQITMALQGCDGIAGAEVIEA